MAEPSPPFEPGYPEHVENSRIVDTLVEIHKMLAIIDGSRSELLPGELQEPFHEAWVVGSGRLRALTAAASYRGHWREPTSEEQEASESIALGDLNEHGLTGPEGWLKRLAWNLRYNRFLHLFKTSPRTPEQIGAARREGTMALDLGNIVVGSIGDSPKVKAVSELIGVARNALDFALYRA